MDQVDLVSGIRAASRDLVRHWGFLGRGVAGTDLSGSAAHALIEIGLSDDRPARDLAARLRLEKSSVSRLVRSLVRRGEIREAPSASDGRSKRLHLTAQGRETLAVIDRVAATQVQAAVARLQPGAQRRVLHGLADYAAALDGGAAEPTGPEPAPRIVRGFRPGLIGRVVEIIAERILPDFPLGSAFECRVAREMAEFIPRADRPCNGIWTAELHGRIVGSITIDGEDLGGGTAHLRWFAVAADAEGRGTGRALLRQAVAHSDAHGFREIQLWTVRGLDAARRLYDREGFVLAEEYEGDQWGAQVVEQKLVRRI